MNALNTPLAELDPEVHAALRAELHRQQSTLEMIASENFAPSAVLIWVILRYVLRENLLAAAVILGGASLLAGPRAAHATYYDPFRLVADGVTYCCSTGNSARCCSTSGCMSRDGVCVVVR